MSSQPRVPAGSPQGGEFASKHGLSDLHAATGHVHVRQMTTEESDHEGAGTAAYYDPNTKVIHLRDVNRSTLAHEMGHALDHKLGSDPESWRTNDTGFSAALRADQKTMDVYGRHGVLGPQGYYGSRKEAFAELVALHITGDGSAIPGKKLAAQLPRTSKYVRDLLVKQGLVKE